MTVREASKEALPDLRTSDFEYSLPETLIASKPASRRDGSRLLVLDRTSGELLDSRFQEFVNFPAAGDALVLNDSRVFPARLTGYKPTGAPAEIMLLRPHEDVRIWDALIRPGSKLKPGREVRIAPGFTVRIDEFLEGGGRKVTLETDGDPWAAIERHGQIPLPPYIDRQADEEDRVRYQTVYARERGSVAAPTAGLHFTRSLLDSIRQAGVSIVHITLHVGVGTFRPVDAERPEDHQLHAERYRVTATAADALNRVRGAGGKVWAVGTTAARTLESIVSPDGRFAAAEGWTDLFIYPPHEFRGLDRLLTNFHLPRSSLLMLVAALAGVEPTRAAYAHAIRKRYRFYSYGDAMLVL